MSIRVPGSGPSDARIMIVGEAPGREEEVEGQPFVGTAGRVLRNQMLAIGMSPSDVYFTNLAKYRPPGNQLVSWFDAKTGNPNDTVCQGLLELGEEIEAVNPNVIIACGNFPLWALTGKAKWNHKKNAETQLPTGYSGIGDWRGSIVEGRGIAAGRKVVASYHPAAVARKWPWRVYLELDLRRALEQSQFPDIRRPQYENRIYPQGQDRLDFRERLMRDPSRTIFFDTEYVGSTLLCVSFCSSSEETGVIPIKDARDMQFIRSILESGHPLGAQNGMFDCSILEYWFKMKLFPYLVYDTMLAAHAAYIELPKDLGTLCSVYTEQPCYWTEISWDAIKKGKQPVSDVYVYNGIDAWVTHEVAKCQQGDELQDTNVKNTFDFEMSLLQPLWNMARKGVRVDLDMLAKLRADHEDNIAAKGSVLDMLYGKPLNVMSGPAMAAFLYGTLGFPKSKFTKGGKPASDDKTLAALALAAKDQRQRGAIELVRDVKRSRSLISKFCDIEFDSDGRFRSHYNPAGTDTGRLASRKFFPTGTGGNGQNIPRLKAIRKLFKPDPGYVFFYNDLERAESLVVAHLTQDPLMLAHHAPKADAHRLLAVELYEKPFEEITDDERYMGKQTRHAGNYMQGWMTFMNNVNKLAEATGVSVDAATAKRFIQKYRDLHIGLTPWWRRTERTVQETGKLYNLLGRMRYFFDRVQDNVPAQVAYVPQSTVGDVLNVALVRCSKDEELRDYGVQFLMQIHDAIGGQVPEKYMVPAMTRMRQLMRVELINPNTLEPFAIPVEIAVGPSWGEVKKWEEDLKLAA